MIYTRHMHTHHRLLSFVHSFYVTLLEGRRRLKGARADKRSTVVCSGRLARVTPSPGRFFVFLVILFYSLLMLRILVVWILNEPTTGSSDSGMFFL